MTTTEATSTILHMTWLLFLLTNITKKDLCQIASVFDGIKAASFSRVCIINVPPILCVDSFSVATATLYAHVTHGGHYQTRQSLLQ